MIAGAYPVATDAGPAENACQERGSREKRWGDGDTTDQATFFPSIIGMVSPGLKG